MKKLAALGLILVSCSQTKASTPEPAAGITTRIITTSQPVALGTAVPEDNAAMCALPQAYPEGAPALRTDLYVCSSIGENVSSSPRFRTFLEIMNDGTRRYHVSVTLNDSTVETFDAEENKIAAAPYTPLKIEAGARQSSNVLHGMNAQTKAAFGLDNSANWQINVKSSSMRPNIEMFMTTVDDSGNERSLGIFYGVCARFAQ